MSFARSVTVAAWVGVVVGLVGCKTSHSSLAGGSDGALTDSAALETGIDRGLDAGDPDSAAGGAPDAGTSGAVYECYPDCLKALRQTCERPPLDAGACSSVAIDGGTLTCYSNGVRQTLVSVGDGGSLATFTEPDGHTVCYRVSVDSTSLQHFETTSGQEVGQLMPLGNSMYRETCSGVNIAVDSLNPTCATLNVGNCTPTGVPCP